MPHYGFIVASSLSQGELEGDVPVSNNDVDILTRTVFSFAPACRTILEMIFGAAVSHKRETKVRCVHQFSYRMGVQGSVHPLRS